MIALFKALQVILALSILIAVHELGHYTFAKLFHIRVDKFYLFFDVKGVRLFSTRHNRFVKKFLPRLANAETDYGIGWLPLGGYCKINGMVDESMDTEYLKREPQPWEFRSHPAWQRLLVMFGGVLFNFILAAFVYMGMLYSNGRYYIANEEVSIYPNALAQKMGFRAGDKVLAYDDFVPEDFSALQMELVRCEPSFATVLRDGDTVRLWIDNGRKAEMLNTPGMFDLAVPFVVNEVGPGYDAAARSLEHGDRIVRIDHAKIDFMQDAVAYLTTCGKDSVTVDVLRGADTLCVRLPLDENGRIGVSAVIPGYQHVDYTLGEAALGGVKMVWGNMAGYVRDLKLVFNPSTGAYKSVGSFISIGQVFPSMWNWTAFFSILSLLSIMLGVMNLLPIPGLDGGHMVIVLFEMLTGRKPSDKLLMVLQVIGMVLIIMLMLLAFGNDIGRLIR